MSSSENRMSSSNKPFAKVIGIAEQVTLLGWESETLSPPTRRRAEMAGHYLRKKAKQQCVILPILLKAGY